ncbi:MAG: alpha-1,2-fucosyltransferase [Lachnospiraceae bacterium]|jgi:hypothetical protein
MNTNEVKIHVDISGRLGNQLFQYATARALQKQYGGKIVLNTYELQRYKDNFRLELTDFKLNENVIIETEKMIPYGRFLNSLPIKAIRKYCPNLFYSFAAKFGIIAWKPGLMYKKIPDMSQYNDIVLYGYFQSAEYFNDIKEIIQDEITPKFPCVKENKELYDLIKETESVCITIRRGDYVANPQYKKMWYVCDENYFNKAVNEMIKKIPNAVFFVFSDDVQWCKENLNFGRETYYESGNDEVWEKVRLMSACKHFIISNSSFSWWVQYLSRNQDKLVIAPSSWYNSGPGMNKKVGVYEDHWTLIKI